MASPVARSEVEVSRQGTDLRVAGDLDITTVNELHNALMDHVEADLGLRLDLADVSFIDSSGLRILLHCREYALHLGGDVTLTAVSKRVLEMLDVSGTVGLFTADPASLTEAPQPWEHYRPHS